MVMQIKEGYIKSPIHKMENCNIGSCKRFKQRAREHQRTLVARKHHNKHLQHAFDKYGVECFLFEVIEVVSDGSTQARREKEQEHISVCEESWDECYNIAKKVINKQGPWSSTQEETGKKVIKVGCSAPRVHIVSIKYALLNANKIYYPGKWSGNFANCG